MKITIIGSGYVGLSNAVLLAQNNSVIILDIVSEKINLLNRFESPIDDDEIKDVNNENETENFQVIQVFLP